jgi:anti-sigma regulatory factor (Ser/Thr protein kinase)
MKPREGFAVTIGIDLAEIDRVNAAFAEFAEARHLPAKIRRTMRVVFDELLNNAISYGFRGRDAGAITVDVGLTDSQLSVTITDDGQPFDPLQTDPPDTSRSTQERKIGGLGIYLVRQAMDEVRYERLADRNVLRLAKVITED